MKGQLIISVSREYGSGGHYIAELLAEKFELPLLDHNLLDEIAKHMNGNKEKLLKYDELPKMKLSSRKVRGFSNSPEEIVAQLQFDYIKKKAEKGESFVIVGRCAESVLKGNDGLISIFVLGDYDKKLKRIQRVRGLDEKQAKDAMKRHDKNRRSYHNTHCDIAWGDSRNYDICINSSRLGEEKIAEYLAEYIRQRIEE